jgi:phage terminase large subunit-like protein
LRYILDKYEGTRLGRQELAGEILEANPDALWKRERIDELRVINHPELIRVVVGVDPEATNTETSAETGIIVAGIGIKDGQVHGYVLDDLSLKASPNDWASAAVTGYHKHKADRIIGEVNNGGDMVEYTVKTVDNNVAFTKVHASRGKYLRAEPVSALYEQGRIHHVGFFPDLEEQMCEWVPGETSPDHLDALVWAITDLMLQEEEIESIVTFDAMKEFGLDRL